MTYPDELQITAGGIEWRSVYCGNHPSLKAGAALDDTLPPTMTMSTGGPSLSSKQVSGTKRVKALFTATGVTPGLYTLTVLAVTDEATPQTIAGRVAVRVL
jgi:hypothetical protein